MLILIFKLKWFANIASEMVLKFSFHKKISLMYIEKKYSAEVTNYSMLLHQFFMRVFTMYLLEINTVRFFLKKRREIMQSVISSVVKWWVYFLSLESEIKCKVSFAKSNRIIEFLFFGKTNDMEPILGFWFHINVILLQSCKDSLTFQSIKCQSKSYIDIWMFQCLQHILLSCIFLL